MAIRARGIAASWFALACAVAARADDGGLERQIIPGERHSADGFAWSDTLEREHSDYCGGTGNVLKPVPGFDCVVNELFVENQSERAMQCRVFLDLPEPDIKGAKTHELEVVLYGHQRKDVIAAYGRAANAPSRFGSDCRVIPETASSYSPNSNCKFDLKLPSAEAFYPPASRRREEQGSPVVEFGVDAVTHRATDARIVAISGFPLLDTAALAMIGAARAEATCLHERYRVRIGFKLER